MNNKRKMSTVDSSPPLLIPHRIPRSDGGGGDGATFRARAVTNHHLPCISAVPPIGDGTWKRLSHELTDPIRPNSIY